MTVPVSTRLTPELASRFASLALAHVRREYPNKLDHVINGAEDLASPSAQHPVFFGSFDWHSCVHGYWLLARPALYALGRLARAASATFSASSASRSSTNARSCACSRAIRAICPLSAAASVT